MHAVAATVDQIFQDIAAGLTSKMPRYNGDLELIDPCAGFMTSRAYHHRWFRKNEILADAAEKASVAASWLGALLSTEAVE